MLLLGRDRNLTCPADNGPGVRPLWVNRSDRRMAGEVEALRRATSIAPQRTKVVRRSTVSRMDLASMIESRDGVRSGKPCCVSTRITVDDVLEYLASGMTTEEILHDFPVLTDVHIRAALAFGDSAST